MVWPIWGWLERGGGRRRASSCGDSIGVVNLSAPSPPFVANYGKTKFGSKHCRNPFSHFFSFIFSSKNGFGMLDLHLYSLIYCFWPIAGLVCATNLPLRVLLPAAAHGEEDPFFIFFWGWLFYFFWIGSARGTSSQGLMATNTIIS